MQSLSSDFHPRLAWGICSTLSCLLLSACVLDKTGATGDDKVADSGFTDLEDPVTDPDEPIDAGSNQPDEPDEPQNPSRPRDAATDSRVDAATSERVDSAVTQPPSKEDAGGEAPKDAGGEADANADAAPVVDASGPKEGECKLSGSYALRTEVDLQWDGWALIGIPILSAGQGTFRMDALSILNEDGRTASVRACSIAVPDFETEKSSSGSNELYGMYIPDEVWDRPQIPTWSTSWGSSCNRPGCTLFTGVIEAVLGARLTGDQFSWPGPRDPRTNFEVVDDDGDGQPGITALVKGPNQVNAQGRPYSYPPLAPSLFARARKVMLAVGMRSQIEGKLEDCDTMSGALTVSQVNTRGLGCVGLRGNEEFMCTQQHVQFLDENMPAYKLKNARYRQVRVRDGASCADVRAALPPLTTK